ncbi:MAG: sigma-70 family RNA polymerase sigma factor [Deltaproteobacteria bacterium]
MNAPRPSDTRLVEAAMAGEPQAVKTLVSRLMPVVCARVRHSVAKSPGSFDALRMEDMVQEVWVKLLDDDGRRLRAYDAAKKTTLEGFVGLVTEREVAHLREHGLAKKRGGHLRAVELEDARLQANDASPEAQVSMQDLAARLAEHLEATLPTRGRLVFRHAFTDGRAPPEVAQLMGVTVQVVYNWQHKIRAAARSFLED